MKCPAKFSKEAIGPEAKKAAQEFKAGEILVLENTRFYPGETKNDAQMAKELHHFEMPLSMTHSVPHTAHMLQL